MDHYTSARYDPAGTGVGSWQGLGLLRRALQTPPPLPCCPAVLTPLPRSHVPLLPPPVLPWSHLHGPLPQATLVKHLEEAQRHM
jgi:hypothetical protein